MSASQEKRKRREERADGVEKKQVQRNRTAKMKKRNAIIKTVVTTVVVVFLVLMVILNSTLFTSGSAAVTMGNHDYSAVEFNYYYQNAYISAYTNLTNTYGEYASYLLNPNKSLKDQAYSETQSWDDYFEESALKSMQQAAILNDAAQAEGFTLTAEERAQINSDISTMKTDATGAGYKTFKQYLTAMYGKGFTEEHLTELLTSQTLASSYSQELLSRYEYSDDQLLAKYDTVQHDYNLVTFCYYFVDGSADEEAGISADAAMNQAYSTAQAIAAAKTEDVFAELVRQYCSEAEAETYADDSAVLRRNMAPGSLSATYADWLTDPARVYGDTTYIEGTNGYYVLLFVESNHNDYTLRNFRHILVKVDPDAETGEILPEAVTGAQVTANQYYDEWKEDPTEEKFIEMAEEHSADTGSNTNGGLYENVVMGQMVPEIEDWLFEEGREAGDHTLVYVKSSNYSGYHILYFVGEGEQYNLRLAENLQLQEDYEQWIADRSVNYEIDKRFAFRFAK